MRKKDYSNAPHTSERNTQTNSDGGSTKQSGKRRKWRHKDHPTKGHVIGWIYRNATDCQVADRATELRLDALGRLGSANRIM